MTLWEDMTALEQAAILYSDAHKDAYGFRPRDGGIHCPVTLADYDAAMIELGDIIARNEAEEAAREAAALDAFNTEVGGLMAQHRIDRETALRWWFEAEGYVKPLEDCPAWRRQNAEHVLWKRGLPQSAWAEVLDIFAPRPAAWAA